MLQLSQTHPFYRFAPRFAAARLLLRKGSPQSDYVLLSLHVDFVGSSTGGWRWEGWFLVSMSEYLKFNNIVWPDYACGKCVCVCAIRMRVGFSVFQRVDT